jgi:glycosyltransferase involved in cell wall biosynthesis
MMKFALISHILPPSPSGQSVILYRILSSIKEDVYYLIGTRYAASPDNDMDGQFRLRGQYYYLPPEPTFKHAYRFGLSWILKTINIFIKLYVRTRNILGVLRSEPNTTAIVVCTGDFVDLPAGYLVSRICAVPFYAYIFDDYLYQFIGAERWIVKLIAPYIFKHSTGIIGPNEFICQEYHQRYGVTTALVRNPCDKTELEKEPFISQSDKKNRIKIVYTGAIYLANFGCFRNLIQSMKLLQEYPIELHIFTSQTPDQLAGEGIQGEKIFIHPHLSYSEVFEHQRNGDILFLPLAFESPIPEIIRTSAPGKFGEYLASGRPVLAHVPADSFVAYYLEKNQCGLVASENDPSRLKDHILKLINDKEFCRTITQNAYQRAKLDFDPQVAGENLLEFLSISMRKNQG